MTYPDTNSIPRDTDIPRLSRSSKHSEGSGKKGKSETKQPKDRHQRQNRLPPLPETRERGRPCLRLKGALDLCVAEALGRWKRQKLLPPRAPVPVQPCQASAMIIWALNFAHPLLTGGQACGGRGAAQERALRIQRYLFPGALLGCGPNPPGEPGEVAPAGEAV